ncbi:hypothetical protein MXD58_014315, partial [Frankia sp. AgKG'84/4]|nr:hypothetical protein [Frankia sp. AgKG'84/4]
FALPGELLGLDESVQADVEDGTGAGLAQAAALTSAFTGRGLRVVLRLVPAAGEVSSVATLTAGLARLADRFRDEPGLLGYEVGSTATAAGGSVIRGPAASPTRPPGRPDRGW